MNERIDDPQFPLGGIRVIELGDYRGEFCGRLLAGLGAEVVRIEPPPGSPSRGIGPFYDDAPPSERSIFWWTYNLGKKSVALDLDAEPGRARLGALLDKADVLLDSLGPGGLERLGLEWDALQRRNPRLIVLSLSDFGLDGPWAGYRGNDLVMLAVGGQMMLSGYPPASDGSYDTPPIAPQMHHSIHMAGCLGANDVLAALAWRDEAGHGQRIDLSLHAAGNFSTENNLAWYMAGGVVSRRKPQCPEMLTKDGKYVQVMFGSFPEEWQRNVDLLDALGDVDDLNDPKYAERSFREQPGVKEHVDDVFRKFVSDHTAVELFHEAQKRGAVWGPILEAHDSLDDPHFSARGSFAGVFHDYLGKEITYPASPWVSERLPWKTGPRAPTVGEHNASVFSSWLGSEA